MPEWILISEQMPETSVFVLANIKDNNYYYQEVLCYDSESRKWLFHDNTVLSDHLVVIAWKEIGSTYVGS